MCVSNSNEDDIDDEDTNEEVKAKSNVNNATTDVAEPSPGPSASSETLPSAEGEERVDEPNDDKQTWPSMTDLNTRLRRVITSYQRNYRKEEQKIASKTKVHATDFLIYSTFIIIVVIFSIFLSLHLIMSLSLSLSRSIYLDLIKLLLYVSF